MKLRLIMKMQREAAGEARISYTDRLLKKSLKEAMVEIAER